MNATLRIPATEDEHEEFRARLRGLDDALLMENFIQDLMEAPALDLADLCGHAALHYTSHETERLYYAVVALKAGLAAVIIQKHRA